MFAFCNCSRCKIRWHSLQIHFLFLAPPPILVNKLYIQGFWRMSLYRTCALHLLRAPSERCGLLSSYEGPLFLIITVGGVHLGPLGMSPSIGPSYLLRAIMRMGRIWWNDNWRGKPKSSEKTCLSATLSTTNPTWPDRARNRAVAVGSQRLTTWAMAQPKGHVIQNQIEYHISWRFYQIFLYANWRTLEWENNLLQKFGRLYLSRYFMLWEVLKRNIESRLRSLG
jgi:hypothetical protein